MEQQATHVPVAVIVEDDQEQRHLIVALLEETDLQVVDVDSAEQALDYLRQGADWVALVFTEIDLPWRAPFRRIGRGSPFWSCLKSGWPTYPRPLHTWRSPGEPLTFWYKLIVLRNGIGTIVTASPPRARRKSLPRAPRGRGNSTFSEP